MSDTQYNIQLQKLCDALQLGKLISVPEAISGGFLHRMYSVETTQGRYAIKALNPSIMLRPTAMKRYIESEKIANIAASKIPALPARIFKGNFIHEIDNQFYLVFDWVEGKSLKPNEVNIIHCEKIGSIIANIHDTDFSELDLRRISTDNEQLTAWDYYLQKGQENNAVWVNLLFDSIEDLKNWSAQISEARKHLASSMVISHRDLDPKNVIWDQGEPIIIDWEAAGYINPLQEMAETAIYWSEDENGSIDKKRFLAFINGYRKRYGKLKADWRIILLSGYSSKLGWLEYSLKRSLMIDCTDMSEQQLGTAQVIETIGAIKRYAEMILEIEAWLKSV